MQHLIYCYWELKSTGQLTGNFNYRVIADGCIDIYFERSHPKISFIMGLCNTFTVFPLGTQFHYIGIRFLPTAFPLLFNSNAASFSNKVTNLGDINSNMANFIEHKIPDEIPANTVAKALDSYFLDHLTNIQKPLDKRLFNAVEIVLAKQGIINVQKDLQTGISQRQLRRLFAYYIGTSVKAFSQIIRFQHILQNEAPSHTLQKNSLSLVNGYYDQAHFIKEFKNFYGVTPKQR